jgi:hypothetical protein
LARAGAGQKMIREPAAKVLVAAIENAQQL